LQFENQTAPTDNFLESLENRTEPAYRLADLLARFESRRADKLISVSDFDGFRQINQKQRILSFVWLTKRHLEIPKRVTRFN